jgi:hypothetical protein
MDGARFWSAAVRNAAFFCLRFFAVKMKTTESRAAFTAVQIGLSLDCGENRRFCFSGLRK